MQGRYRSGTSFRHFREFLRHYTSLHRTTKHRFHRSFPDKDSICICSFNHISKLLDILLPTLLTYYMYKTIILPQIGIILDNLS